MTELNQKVAEYIKKLDGISYREWQRLCGAINFAFREKQRKLHDGMELAAYGDVIVGDDFTDTLGYIPGLYPEVDKAMHRVSPQQSE